MQKRLQQLAGAALDSLGLSKIEDTQLLAHLRSLDEMEVSLRDIEKVSSEVFSYFENMQSSMLCVITASTELTTAFDKDSVLKDTLSRYKNLYSTSTSKIEKELKTRIEENIFAKLEIRREVMTSIHKRIEECSQLNARYANVEQNLQSVKSDEQALKDLTAEEVAELEAECTQLRALVDEKRQQLDTDIENYVTNTRQFLTDCYTYLGSLNSLVLASFNTSLTEIPQSNAFAAAPPQAEHDSTTIRLAAGLSTIHYVELTKGAKVWWEATVEGGDVGFGVLFKRMVKTKQPVDKIDKIDKSDEINTIDATASTSQTEPPEASQQPQEGAAGEQEASKGEVEEKVETSPQLIETPKAEDSPQEIAAEISVKSEKNEDIGVIERPVIETIMAIHRVDPSKEDIRGVFECTEDGCLEFGFDNSFSYFRSKTIELTVSVVN